MTQQTMYPAVANSPATEIAIALTISATTISVLDASKLPAGPNLATIGVDESAETIQYTAKSGNTLTGVTRGFNGTTAKAWAVGSAVARNFTAYDADALRENVADHSAQLAEKANQIAAILNPPRAQYSSNVDKVCATYQWVYPDWNVKTYDTNNFVNVLDPTTVVVNVSGTYLIHAHITFAANATGQRSIRITKNALADTLAYSSNVAVSNAMRINVATTAFLNAGETFQISGYQDTGANLALATAAGIKMSITLLCPP